MPRDPRPFITLHDGMPEHPKIEALSDAALTEHVDPVQLELFGAVA